MTDLLEVLLEGLLCSYICCPPDTYTEHSSNNSQYRYQDTVYNDHNILIVESIPIRSKYIKRE